jgi:hypothetical protein
MRRKLSSEKAASTNAPRSFSSRRAGAAGGGIIKYISYKYKIYNIYCLPTTPARLLDKLLGAFVEVLLY